MDTNLLTEVAKIQQDIYLLRTMIATLQTRVDDLVARLQGQAHDQSLKFTDLEGMWEGADFSLENVKTVEYQISKDWLFYGKIE